MRDVAVVGFTQSKSLRREFDRNETEILIPVIHGLKKELGLETKDIDFICSGSSDYLAGQSFAFVAGLDAIGASTMVGSFVSTVTLVVALGTRRLPLSFCEASLVGYGRGSTDSGIGHNL